MQRLRNQLTCIFAFVACACFTGSAQQDAGSISGTVFDANKALVPGAKITLTDTNTGFSRSTESTTKGEYIFTPLRAGTYQISLTSPGFKTEVRGPLELQVQQRLNLDFDLVIGTATEKVTVTTAATALQTEDASVGQVIDTQQVKDLPLNGRDVYQLVTVTPGVSVDLQGRAAVGGHTSENQYYGMDGVDNNNYSGILANGRPSNLNPSPDTVEEFKVQTANYSAEFGQSAGGVVNVVTKSGTNEFHGTAYEYLRNQVFDARLYFAQPGESKAPFKQNQFGGTIGGPILHDRLFFFSSYEEFRQNRGNTVAIPVAPAAWRVGDFSSYLAGSSYVDPCTGASYDTGQLFDPTSSHTANCLDGSTATIRNPIQYNGLPNVVNPAEESPAALNIIKLIPTPCATCGNTFVWSPVTDYNYRRANAKIDYQWAAHDRLSGHYFIQDTPSYGAPYLPNNLSPGTLVVGRQQGVIAGDTHVFSSSTINELRYVWSQDFADTMLGGLSFNAASVGLGGIPYQQGLLGGLPTFNFSDTSGFGASQWSPSISEARDNQISDALSMVRGNHSFKFGGAFNHYGWIQYLSQQPLGVYTFTGSLTNSTSLPAAVQQGSTAASAGSGFAQFLYGQSDTNGLSRGISSNNTRNTGAVYVQDDWKATPRLTINAGLRWEFGSGLHEAQDRVAGVDLNTGAFTLPASRRGKSPSLPAGLPVEYINNSTLMNPRNLNFGPRLGVSYKWNDKTVLRAGVGIFYANPFPAGVLGYPLNPPFGVAVQGPNLINIDTGFPSGYLDNFNPQQLAIELYELKPHAPTTNSWNAAVQRELPGGTAVEVAYAGSTSTHVNAGRDLNQPSPTADPNISASARRAPQLQNLGILGDVLNMSNGNYNSLQAKFEKRFSHGTTFLLAYTWSHSLDDAPSNITLSEGENYDFYRNAFQPQEDYGNSYFDIRHRIVLNGLYLLPVGRGHALGANMPRWADEALGGWQVGGIVQFQTGYHFGAVSYVDPSNSDIYTYSGTAYPNVVGDTKDYSSCPGGHRSINCWFNPNAFALSNPGQFGNEARNSLVGPNNFDVDASLIKSFPITEKYRFQFRAEAFNASNHPNLALPSNVLGPGYAAGGNFGQITGVGNQRQIQIAVRFEF